jgi:hypothetical protein
LKSLITISLGFLFLVESLFPRGLALVESSKLMKLVEHFQEHVLESKNQMSFAEFLWMHYNPNSNHENNKHHHEKLPNLSNSNTFVGFIYESITNKISPLVSNCNLRNVLLPEYKNGYQFIFSLDLLHPPQ